MFYNKKGTESNDKFTKMVDAFEQVSKIVTIFNILFFQCNNKNMNCYS